MVAGYKGLKPMLKLPVQKMKRHISIVFFLLVFLSGCKKDKAILPNDSSNIENTLVKGNGSTSFQRIVGGQKIDGFYSVKQTADGGFVFCGFTENQSASERDILLLKTSSDGSTSWIKTFTDSYTDQGWFVDITTDNGFILAATSSLSKKSQAPVNYSGQLIKTDSNGIQLWKHTFTFGNYTNFTTVRQTPDGGFIVSGVEYNSDNGILLKTDASGNESWRKTFAGHVELNSIDKTADGGFILCGSIKSSSSTPNDIYVVRTNSSGDTIWTNTFGDSSDNTSRTIKEIASGNFILCGYNSNTPNGASGFIKLIDANGGEIWNRDFHNDNIQALESIITTNDNQFIAVGRESFSSNSQAYLLKIDGNGNKVWQKSFSAGGFNMFSEVQQATDNGFIVAGYSLNSENGNGFIVKTDINGD